MNENNILYTSVGKRKTSVAKVFFKEGSGVLTINQKKFEEFFAGVVEERDKIKRPLILTDLEQKYDILISVSGGGISSQMEAIRLAIAKSICKINTDYRQILRKELLLRRDSRIKERRKYGLKKARKASQYSKR